MVIVKVLHEAAPLVALGHHDLREKSLTSLTRKGKTLDVHHLPAKHQGTSGE
jgi:hypothetical protein